jgi:hypothetical protein
MNVPGLFSSEAFVVKEKELEDDGIHLTAAAGDRFMSLLGQEIRHYLVCPLVDPLVDPVQNGAEATEENDATMVNVSDDGEESDSSDDPEEVAMSSSDQLKSILEIVKGNSRKLATVAPLKKAISDLTKSGEDFQSQVRIRRQQDNAVFARIKEESDSEVNRSREDRVVISGLTRASSGLSTHAEKKEYYSGVVTKLVASSCAGITPVPLVVDIFVNFRRAVGNPVIEVRFDTVAGAGIFRRAAAVMAKAKDPPEFAPLFFSNSVTQATRVRIEIMRVIAQKLDTATEKAYVQGFISRPVLHYAQKDPAVPSHGAGVGRSYSFVDAVTRFGDLVRATDLSPAYKRAGSTFTGAMEQYFVVLREVGALGFRLSGSNQAPLSQRGSRGGRGGARGVGDSQGGSASGVAQNPRPLKRIAENSGSGQSPFKKPANVLDA